MAEGDPFGVAPESDEPKFSIDRVVDPPWPTFVGPDPARATAFYVKAIALMLFTYLFSSLGAVLTMVSEALLWLVFGGLLAVGTLFLAAKAYLLGNRYNRQREMTPFSDEA